MKLYQPAAQDNILNLRLLSSPCAPRALAQAVSPELSGTAISALDPDLTVRALMPVTARMEEVTSQMRLCQQSPPTAFAVLCFLLAGVGIYEAMARMVAQRTNEIGLRLALGAQVSSVVALVFWLRSPHRGPRRWRRHGWRLRAFANFSASALPTMRTDETWSASPAPACWRPSSWSRATRRPVELHG